MILLGAIALAVALGAVGPGGASVPDGIHQTNDTEEPTVGDLSRVDVTTLELEILDNVDVDESSIEVGDFDLSAGTLSNVTTSEDGSNATVTLNLIEVLDQDEVTVSIDENATIADATGWELNPGDAPDQTVDGMDGVSPHVHSLTVENGTDGEFEVRVRATEPLGELTVSVLGLDGRVLNLEDFSKSSGFATYETVVEPDVAGEYRVRVSELADQHNNSRSVSIYKSVTVDGIPPDAVAGVDFTRSDGLVFTFDASRTTDAHEIERYEWDFGDGSAGTGERVTHRFEPGNYTVTLSATDAFGNTATDTLVLNLTNQNGSVDAAELLGLNEITISGSGSGGSAVVDVPVAPANETLELKRTNGDPIVSRRSVTLESMAVRLSRNSTYSIGVQLDGPTAVGDVATSENRSVVAGLTLVHDVPDAWVRNATLTIGIDRGRPNATVDARVYRFENGSWNSLRRETVNGTNGSVHYRVHSPGLSRFVITRNGTVDAAGNESTSPTPTETTATPTTALPPLAVVDASLNATAVEENATVGVSATVRNRKNETANFTVGLTVDGTVVETRQLTIPAGETRDASFAYEPREPGSYPIAVNGTGAGTLQVGGGSGGGPLAVLGFLPLGLLQLLVTYVGGLLVAVFLLLKATALYLGY